MDSADDGLPRPTEAEQHLNQALDYEEDDRFEEALFECDVAIEMDPSLADAHNVRAIVLEELGRPQEAATAYKRALELDPEFVEAAQNLLDLEAELGIVHDLVTIATFSHAGDAHVLKSRLEAEGIRCFVADEQIINLYWLYCLAVGRVKLQVDEPDAERALDILSRREEVSDFVDVEQPRCPRCDSFYTRYHRYHLRVAFASWLLLGVALPFPKRKWRCSDCGYEWKWQAQKL